MKTYIVVPAFNEVQKIGGVIKDLHRYGYKNIIVVDDCSRDDTGNVAFKEGATVLRHVINRGQGAALKTGIQYSLEHNADIIVTFDADGQHQAKDVNALLEPIKDGSADAVIGSRFLTANENVPLSRKIALFGGKIFLFIVYGIKVTDSQSGLRALSRNAALQISFNSDRMEHCGEILGEIHKKKIRLKEVPIHVLYTEYSKQKGQSVLNSVNIACKLLMKKFFK